MPHGAQTLTGGSPIRTALPDELVAKVRALGERYGIRNIRVFGSVARGEAGAQSDIDFLVEYVPGHGGFAFAEFCEKLEELLGRSRVDVVTENSLHPMIREKIFAQALPL